MTIGPVERISRGQLFWLVAMSVVAGGVYNWPQTAIRYAGADAPWALALTVGLAIALAAGEVAWARRVPGITYFDRLRGVWGGFAWFWFAGTTVLCVAVDAAMLALFAQMLHVFFYPDTPTWVMRVLLVGVAGRFASQSLPVLARNVQFWFPLILVSFFVLVGLSVPHMHELGSLRPGWPPTLPRLDAGVLATWYLWTQGPLLVTLAPWVSGASWEGIRRWGLSAYLFQGFMLVATGTVVVGTLGRWVPQTLAWPLIYVFVNLGPEAFFIARPGVLVLPTWAAAIVFYLAVRTFCGSINLQAALRGSGANRRWIVLGIVVAVAMATLLYPTPEAVTRSLFEVVDPVAVWWMIAHTLFTFAIAVVRGRRPGGRETLHP